MMLVSRVVLKASGCFEDAERRILAFSTRTACSCVFHGKVHSQITVAIPNSHQNEQADFSANKQSEQCECFPCVIFVPIFFAAFRDITDISPEKNHYQKDPMVDHVPCTSRKFVCRPDVAASCQETLSICALQLATSFKAIFTKDKEVAVRPLTRPISDPRMEYLPTYILLDVLMGKQ